MARGATLHKIEPTARRDAIALDQGRDQEVSLRDRVLATRRRSLELAAPLGPEDMVVQAMEDASPTKWHLAHVTWFFETFVLKPHLPGYEIFDETFNFCFNSYYEALGHRQPRYLRGLLTRPPPAPARRFRAARR